MSRNDNAAPGWHPGSGEKATASKQDSTPASAMLATAEKISIPIAKAGAYVATLPLSVIKIGDRFRKDHGDLDALAASIKELGLLQPIGIDRNHNLIFGHRRYLAHERLGRESIQARIIEVTNLLQAEHAENEIRKDFTASERVAIAKAIEDEIGERRGGDRKSNVEFSTNDPLAGKRTDEIAAEKAGFGSKDTYRQARKVTEEAVPELVDAMDRKDISISTAAKLAEALPEVQRQAAATPKTAPKLARKIMGWEPERGFLYSDDDVFRSAKLTDEPSQNDQSGDDLTQEPKPRREPKSWQNRQAHNYVTGLTRAINTLKGYESHLLPEDRARAIKNLTKALTWLEQNSAKAKEGGR